MSWVIALKKWNEGKEKWCIPKKGSKGYEEVLKIMNRQKGNGLKEVVDKVVTVTKNVIDALQNGIRKHGNPAFRKMVEKYGNKKIKGLTLQRKPIDAQYKRILNVLTSGKLNKRSKTCPTTTSFTLQLFWKLKVANI